MPTEQTLFQPDSKFARAAHISSFEQYKQMYEESIESPEKFWGEIATQFHWETPADPKNFFSYNFDISKGPISIKWMEGATTNICYNILDRNIRNGHGDKIAYFWWVENNSDSCVGGKIDFSLKKILSPTTIERWEHGKCVMQCQSKGDVNSTWMRRWGKKIWMTTECREDSHVNTLNLTQLIFSISRLRIRLFWVTRVRKKHESTEVEPLETWRIGELMT